MKPLVKKYKYEIVMILVMLIALAMPAHAQKIVRDSAGNFYSITHPKDAPVLTKFVYRNTRDGKVYPVYMSSTGKFFVVMVSKKTGNPYKKILQ